jgi:serine/threonine protein kinase
MEDIYNFKGKKICDKEIYFNKIVNGSNFLIYSACLDKSLKDCNKILVKVYEIKKRGWIKKEDIEKEANYMTLGYELGISPEILGIEECKYNGKEYMFIVMENYGKGTLTELLKSEYIIENEEKIKKELKRILDVLYDNNINHNDLHSNNFLYDIKEDETIELKIIDYDNSGELNEKRRNYKIEIIGSDKKLDVK